jgi:HSP20 family molecular chaperone IbpA
VALPSVIAGRSATPKIMPFKCPGRFKRGGRSGRIKPSFALERETTMNALTRYENKWNPFKEMEDLSNRLTALLGRSFGRVPVRTSDTEETLTLSEWAPLVDITEDDKEYLIKAELPEVTKNDLKVTVENGVLQVHVAKSEGAKPKLIDVKIS